MHRRDGEDDAEKEDGEKDKVIEGAVEPGIEGKLSIEPFVDEAEEGDEKTCEKNGRQDRHRSFYAVFGKKGGREDLPLK